MSRLPIAWLRLTGCSGCQLSLLNAEPLLASAAPHLEVTSFALISSTVDDDTPVPVALVEGAVTCAEELAPLFALRRRSTYLLAVGACALSGGVPALAGEHRGERFNAVYGEDKPCTSFPPQPVHRFVQVDHEIAGCPPEPDELLAALGAALCGGLPDSPMVPVCFECRLQENACQLFESSPQQPCLGPLTRGGCGARCPSLGIACEGCRGRIAEARTEPLTSLLHEMGLHKPQIDAMLQRFGEGNR